MDWFARELFTQVVYGCDNTGEDVIGPVCVSWHCTELVSLGVQMTPLQIQNLIFLVSIILKRKKNYLMFQI